MASWGNKRKYTIGAFLLLIVISPIVYLTYKLLDKPPSCTDEKQNQRELGVDCGGPCDLYCRGTVASPVILWSRALKVTYGLYTAAISIQNPNLNAAADHVPYRLRILDPDGVTIYEKYDRVDINPKYTFPIIIPGIRLGERLPGRIVFEFLEEPRWYKKQVEVKPVRITNEVIYNEASSPRIEARVENETVKELENINVGIIVYGSDGNAMAVSKTVLDRVPGSGYSNVVFTWPERFPLPIARKEIIILE